MKETPFEIGLEVVSLKSKILECCIEMILSKKFYWNLNRSWFNVYVLHMMKILTFLTILTLTLALRESVTISISNISLNQTAFTSQNLLCF